MLVPLLLARKPVRVLVLTLLSATPIRTMAQMLASATLVFIEERFDRACELSLMK